jgi:signal transduction histidine kinase
LKRLDSAKKLHFVPGVRRNDDKRRFLTFYETINDQLSSFSDNNMLKSMTLSKRIYFILAGLALINLAGGLVMTWYTYRMESLMNAVIYKNFDAFKTAEALEMALVNQKGFVSYYFMDNDPDWLRQLGEYRQIFKERLAEAVSNIETREEKNIIGLIQAEYKTYTNVKDKVIDYYKSGQKKAGAALHLEARGHFFKILEYFQEYKKIQTQKIMQASSESHRHARNLRITSIIAMATGFILALAMVFVLARQILGPVKQLTLKVDRKEDSLIRGDEIKALSRSVNRLIKDADSSRTELKKSREHLVQAEKMVLVGKLAAGMAHSIRNPFTSVKMRLFSLSRSLKLNEVQKEDFEVISEEIRHIDTVVQNFLEFSRPPRLTLQEVSPSSVVDSTVLLLEHRLKSYKVSIRINREKMLPRIHVDPDQLKEVLVNLVVNACEAMENGGLITITEQETVSPLGEKAVTLIIADTGPGIPASMQDKILQPFFTSKEEGTGLGLSIVERIIAEHDGRLDFFSKEGEGATFIITLFVKENNFGNDSDH